MLKQVVRTITTQTVNNIPLLTSENKWLWMITVV
jgi:hypothetical protein